jgi:SAM-dependent methyltransferase
VTEATAAFLISDEGAALLARGESWLSRVRGLDPEVRAGALAVLEGRERARKRGWEHADSLFLTSDALAQASSEGVAAFHARCFEGCTRVLDACCGLGRDTLALAQAGLRVTAVEADPARLLFARANAECLGVASQIDFYCADITQHLGLVQGCEGALFDPARRDLGGRFSADAERYQPPLSFLSELARHCRVVVAKLSPALPDLTLESLGGSLTFLSEERTCKEACVVLGGERAHPRALLLPGQESYEAAEAPRVAAESEAFLLDPDPAILRAGALGTLAAQTQAALLSPDDAYLTAAVPTTSVGARAYSIRIVLPYRERTLGRWLREQGIGRLIVKKRRYPKEPAAVHKELGLKGKGAEATLVIVAHGKGWLGVVCDPVVAASSAQD